jgi:hypothetical protein
MIDRRVSFSQLACSRPARDGIERGRTPQGGDALDAGADAEDLLHPPVEAVGVAEQLLEALAKRNCHRIATGDQLRFPGLLKWDLLTLAISATSRSCSRWKSVRPSKASALPLPPPGVGLTLVDEGITKGASVDRRSILVSSSADRVEWIEGTGGCGVAGRGMSSSGSRRSELRGVVAACPCTTTRPSCSCSVSFLLSVSHHGQSLATPHAAMDLKANDFCSRTSSSSRAFGCRQARGHFLCELARSATG